MLVKLDHFRRVRDENKRIFELPPARWWFSFSIVIFRWSPWDVAGLRFCLPSLGPHHVCQVTEGPTAKVKFPCFCPPWLSGALRILTPMDTPDPPNVTPVPRCLKNRVFSHDMSQGFLGCCMFFFSQKESTYENPAVEFHLNSLWWMKRNTENDKIYCWRKKSCNTWNV